MKSLSGLINRCGLWLLLGAMSFNLFAQSTAFSAGHLEQLQQQHQGQRWLMLLWSVDCPPCFKELAAISRMHRRDPSLPVVLVNTDGDELVDKQRVAVIEKYRLNTLTNLHFVDGQAAAARYRIDPQWYGELPRSYFYRADGERIARSGLVDTAVINQWLQQKKETR